MMYISSKSKVNGMIEGDVVILGYSTIGDSSIIGNNVIIGYLTRQKLLNLIQRGIRPSYSSYDEVSEGASIGKGCIIRSNTIVYESVILSDGVETGHGVLIRERTIVGNNTKIGTYAVIDGNVTIGNNVNMQSGVYLPPGTKIGNNVFLGPYVTVTNDKYPPSPKISGVHIGSNAVVGSRATLIAGVKIGSYAVVAAGSVVTKDVPAHALVYGNPARIKGFVCRCGKKLKEKGRNKNFVLMSCENCKSEYKIPIEDFNKME